MIPQKQTKKIGIVSSIVLFALAAVACEREKPIELPDSTISVENYDGSAIVQEPDGKVELSMTAQSLAGIKKIEVLVDASVAATVTPENVFTYGYEYTYTVPATAAMGEVITIVFRMEDKQGRTVSTPAVTVRVACPFEISDFTSGGNTFRKISGRINKDLTLTTDHKWLMDSVVSVDQGATLTIEAGTTVYFRTFGNSGKTSRLVIMRGGKIAASGTRAAPVVFTSDKVLTNTAARSDWGGITLNGSAPTNAGSTVLLGGFRYGGSNASDNSGTLRFVRIEHTGKGGFNALQLNGVGSGTLLEYVQVFDSYNIAFRLRGGRVSLRHIAGIQHGGYGIWLSEGWQGNGQFWLFQTGIKATLIPVNYWNQARSIEFRNDDSMFDKQPRTTFRLSNVTLIGNGYDTGTDKGTRRGIRIRQGSEGWLYNAIVTEFPSDAVRVEDLALETLGVNTIIDNIHSYRNFVNWEQEAKTFFFESGKYNLKETAVEGITPSNFVGAVSTAFDPASMGAWFLSAPYIGTVNSSNDWTRGGAWFRNSDGSIRE